MHTIVLRDFSFFTKHAKFGSYYEFVVYTALCMLQIHSLHFVVALITLKALVGQFSCEWDILLSMARNLAIQNCEVEHLCWHCWSFGIMGRKEFFLMKPNMTKILTSSYLVALLSVSLEICHCGSHVRFFLCYLLKWEIVGVGALAASILQGIFHLQYLGKGPFFNPILFLWYVSFEIRNNECQEFVLMNDIRIDTQVCVYAWFGNIVVEIHINLNLSVGMLYTLCY